MRERANDRRAGGPGPREVGGQRLIREVASGEGGEVWFAAAPDGAAVAVKLLRAPDTARFRGEVEALGRLRHPNLVRVLDGGVHEGAPYLVLEWVEGGSLAERLGREGPWGALDAALLVAKVARALEHCHAQGVVHGDLAPRHVLLRVTDQEPLLAGLGPARVGQARDPAADVRGLGRLLQAVLGPSRGPIELDALAGRCLGGGYAAAGDVAEDLERWCRADPMLGGKGGPRVDPEAGTLRLAPPPPALDASHRRPPAATVRPRRVPPGVLVAGPILLAISVPLGLSRWLQQRAAATEAREFLRSSAGLSPEDALARAGSLSELALEDPAVAGWLRELRERGDRATRRANALATLERLPRLTRLEERLEVCQEAIAVDDALGRAWVERARVRYALSKRDALQATSSDAIALIRPALEDTLQAIRVDPQAPDAWLFQAQLYLASGDRTSALTALKRVQDMALHSALGQLAHGLQEEINRRWDGAIASYDQALERDPTLVQVWLGRARARIQKSDYARALSDAREALRRDPTSSEALTLQAEARYYASGRSDRSGPLQDLNRALGLDPCNGHALALRAYTRLERESDGKVSSAGADLEEAERDARKALRVDPEEWLAEMALAEIARARAQKNLPLTHASRAVEMSRHPDAYLLRGRLRAQEGYEDDASVDFDWVLRLTEGGPGYARTRARALTSKAAIHIKRRELVEARQRLEKALELDPNLPEAYYHRGLARYHDYEARGQETDLSQALTDFTDALTRKQALGDAWFYRAMACIDAGRFGEALEDLKQAEALCREGDAGFNVRLIGFYRGAALMRAGEHKRALDCLRRFLATSNPGDRAHTQAKEWIRELERAVGGDGR